MGIVTVPDHPELDEPDGDVPWAAYLDGLSRLDLQVRHLKKLKKLTQLGESAAEKPTTESAP